MKKEPQSMRDINPFGLRMPQDIRRQIEQAAENNKRSLNAEILARLEESLTAEQIASGSEAEKRLSAQFSSLMSEFQKLKEKLDKS